VPTAAERRVAPEAGFAAGASGACSATSFGRAATGLATAGLAAATLTARNSAASHAWSPAANARFATAGRASSGDRDATAQIYPGSALVAQGRATAVRAAADR